jgi:hypothetical protein
VNALTLSAIFEAAKPRLTDELRRCQSPAEKRERLRLFLDTLPDEYLDLARVQGEAPGREDLNKVRDLLDILQAALGAVSIVVSLPPKPAGPGELPGLPEGGLFGRFLARSRAPDSGPGAQDGGHGYRELPRTPDAVRRRARLEVKAVRYLEATETALEAADRVLRAASPEPEPRPAVPGPAPDWAADPQLLELFQDLIAARTTGNPAMALQRIEQLEDDLRSFSGITAVRYDPASEETAGWFSILPPPPGAPAEFVTRRPALVKDEEVLRRGEVRGPSADPAHAAGPVPAPSAQAPDSTDPSGYARSKEHVDD